MRSIEPSSDSPPGDVSAAGGLPGARLRRVTEYIDQNLPGALSLAELSTVVHMSRFHFARLFKRSTGQSPHCFIVHRRIERARVLLEDHTLSVSEVAQVVGFHSLSHFSKTFHRLTGRAPSVYRGLAHATGARVSEPGHDSLPS